jgi:DNA-binding transcriptional ArsR family regulator
MSAVDPGASGERHPPSFAAPGVAAPIFAAFGDETRLALITRLSRGDGWSISQLAQGLQVSRQAITKHLRVLENAGIVRSSRDGRQCLFALEKRRVEELKSYLDEVSAQWDRTLARLRTFVEE